MAARCPKYSTTLWSKFRSGWQIAFSSGTSGPTWLGKQGQGPKKDICCCWYPIFRFTPRLMKKISVKSISALYIFETETLFRSNWLAKWVIAFNQSFLGYLSNIATRFQKFHFWLNMVNLFNLEVPFLSEIWRITCDFWSPLQRMPPTHPPPMCSIVTVQFK